MEVELHETSVVQVDPSSYRNTLKLLPIGKKGKQKFVCGDDNGSISCYEMKRGEPQLVFKTPPGGGPVTALALGGLASAGLKRERIFYAQGQKVTGLNKKGKDFFKLTSSLTENINHMAVEETRIWTGCQYVYNVYDDGKDVGFFMCNDRVNALIVDVITRDNHFDAILGCQDKVVRVIRDSTLLTQAAIDGPVTALCSYVPRTGAAPPTRAATRYVVYGTENGLVGWLTLEPRDEACVAAQGWVVGNGRKLGAVNGLATIDLPRPDTRALVVGRDDGQLQVFEVQGLGSGSPELLFERNVGESIRSLETGIVNTAGYPEIILSCYSGRVVAYTTEPLHDRAGDDSHGRSLGTIQNENKIKTLRKEIEALQAKVEAERERYTRATHETVPLSQPFQVISTFTLDPDEAAYKIIFEIPSPIDLVCLKSTVRLELLDGAGGHDGPGSLGQQTQGSAILTLMEPDVAQRSGAALVACFRAPDSGLKRMVIRARTTEGEYGDIVATVVAKMMPKSAQVMRLRVKPLSLHQRVNELSAEEELRPRNTLRLTGSFSASLMHEWITYCLPEVPPRIASAAEESGGGSGSITLSFRNVFTRSVLLVEYNKGSALISSDSLSTIAIFKEVVCREANGRRIALSDSVKIREETVPVYLGLLHPHLQRQATVARQVELIDAIKELQMQEADTANEWLSEEYQQILKNADALRAEVKRRPRALEYLCGVVTDLFVDLHKFRGDDARHAIPSLHRLLLHYDPQALLDFFAPPFQAAPALK